MLFFRFEYNQLLKYGFRQRTPSILHVRSHRIHTMWDELKKKKTGYVFVEHYKNYQKPYQGQLFTIETRQLNFGTFEEFLTYLTTEY